MLPCNNNDLISKQNIVYKWYLTIQKVSKQQQKIMDLFGYDNDIIECMDELMELYTKSVEAQMLLEDNELMDYWLEDKFSTDFHTFINQVELP